MSDASPDAATGTPPSRTRSIHLPAPPSPDTPAGRILIIGLLAGTVYALLLVGVNTSLADEAAIWVPLVLILGTLVSFFLGTMLGADRGRAQLLELELARTIAVHSGAGQLPEADSPLGKVLRGFVLASDEERRHTRVHAYAAGPAAWGAGSALAAAIVWGLSFSTSSPWVGYVAIVVELPALVLLSVSVAILASAIGWDREVPGFESLTPRRWRRYLERDETARQALAELPWLSAFARNLEESDLIVPRARSAGPWSESAPTA